MNIEIRPSLASGVIFAPPSKSMAHRALICAGLAKGTSVIHNVAFSEDICATMDCLRALGVKLEQDGDTVTVFGVGIHGLRSHSELFCRESGSTLRFFAPICMILPETSSLTGTPKLLSRPLSVYENLCKEQGLPFTRKETCVEIGGVLHGGTFSIPGNISSQFITGLLLVLPLLKQESMLHITGSFESRSYVEMTMQMMQYFGVTAIFEDACTIRIPGKQEYAAKEYTVEGDYSNAAFLEAFNLMGGEVTVQGLSTESLQGDRVYRQIFPLLKSGCPTVSLADCPDLAPVCIALAAANHGAVFTDTRRLRLKESDRGKAMAEELEKFGMRIVVSENEIRVPDKILCKPKTTVYSHNDHRIAMAMSVLLSRWGGEIELAEAVRKSYPNFFEDISKLGIEVQKNENQ